MYAHQHHTDKHQVEMTVVLEVIPAYDRIQKETMNTTSQSSYLCCCVVPVHWSGHCCVWFRVRPPPAVLKPTASSYAEMLCPPSSPHHWERETYSEKSPRLNSIVILCGPLRTSVLAYAGITLVPNDPQSHSLHLCGKGRRKGGDALVMGYLCAPTTGR